MTEEGFPKKVSEENLGISEEREVPKEKEVPSEGTRKEQLENLEELIKKLEDSDKPLE